MIAGSHIQGRKVAQIKETLLEIKTSRPNAGDVVEAQIWYNSAAGQKRIEFKDNSVIVTVPRLDYDETISGNWTINTGAVEPPLILHANNQGTSTSVRVTGFHADILDTFHADTAATASTIAARDANGRIKCTDPSASDDAVNYGFLQGYVAGIRDPKDACEVATTANLAATRSSNTLTASANGSLNTAGIDGITDLAVNDRVLVKNQTTGADNGLYIVSDLGSAGTPWVLQRSSDADTSAEVTNGVQVWVTRGSDNGGTGWLLNTQDPITLNTTALTFIQVNGTADIQQGKGIVIVGNTIHAIQSTDYTTNGLIYASSTSALAMSANLTWNGSTLAATGTGSFTVATNDNHIFSVTNTTSGTGARTFVRNVAGTTTSDFVSYSQGYTTSGDRNIASSCAMVTDGSGGLTLGTIGSAVIRFITADTKKWEITTAGILQANGAQTIQSSSGILTVTGTGGLTLSTAANTNILLSPNGTGKVGINEASPSGKLHISGTTLIDLWMSDTAAALDTKNWSWQAGSAIGTGILRLRALNDANSNGINAIEFNRTGISSVITTFAGGDVRISSLTQKSVLFAGASGAVSQDNANFQVDPTTASTFRFAVGSAVSDFAKTVFGGTFPSASFTAGTTSIVSITGSNSPAASSSARVFHVGGTIVEGTAGAHDVFAGSWFEAPTITAGTSTLNDAATVYIAGAPTATTVNGTWALKILSGNVALGTGNVGIGETSLSFKLVVKGGAAADGIYNTSSSGVDQSNIYLANNGTTANRKNWLITTNYNAAGNFELRQSDAVGGNPYSAGTSRFVISPTGLVGLNGVTAPSFDLSFGGDAARTLALERHTTADTAGSAFTVEAGGCTSGATDKGGGILHLRGGQNTGSGQSTIQFWTCATGGAATTDGTQTLRGSINNAGLWNIVANMTIGTTLSVGTGYQIGGAAAAGKILRGNGTNFVASTATFPDTAAANDLIYASASNTWVALTTVASRVLVTNGSGVPGWAIDLPVGITIGGKDAALIIDGTVTGDGAATTLTYTHSLGRKARIVGVRKQSDDQLVLVDWKPTASFTATKVDLVFAAAPANGEVFEVSVAA